jgi:hypothetical protein
MNNGALVVVLGMNAAAVNGYRAAVISEAARRGLRLVSGSLSDVAWTAAGVAIVDPTSTVWRCSGARSAAGRCVVPRHTYRCGTTPGRARSRCT